MDREGALIYKDRLRAFQSAELQPKGKLVLWHCIDESCRWIWRQEIPPAPQRQRWIAASGPLVLST
jgi:hypothetical protein